MKIRFSIKSILVYMTILFLFTSLAYAGTTIKIASWNIAWLNDENNVGNVKRNNEDYGELKRYADHLDADIIALQEVENEEAAMRVFDSKKYSFHFTKANYDQRSGFAYKKRLNIKKNPDYTKLDVGHVRSGADITLIVNNKEIRLLGVHLKSMCHGKDLDTNSKDCKKLKKQLPILEAWIDARAVKYPSN